jgi:hypothetical protein
MLNCKLSYGVRSLQLSTKRRTGICKKKVMTSVAITFPFFYGCLIILRLLKILLPGFPT